MWNRKQDLFLYLVSIEKLHTKSFINLKIRETEEKNIERKLEIFQISLLYVAEQVCRSAAKKNKLGKQENTERSSK